MAFYLGKLRFERAIAAYETHARIHGLTAHRIRRALSRQEPSGNWRLSDGARIVAIVTPSTTVQTIAPADELQKVVS